ncbi:MAG: PBP1A family penicillin-binding protein [Acidobacteria bacterium]|nr:PBP1A family penicillin-binding protein [Acidobacteriota bacterium]MBI3421696.1 PBP1A family penicillin-binding protein [Acidobacteriota bacterium]
MDKLNELTDGLEEFFRRSKLGALAVLAMVAGGLTGLVVAYQLNFTSYAAEVDALADYRPAEITKVFADDGKTVIGELALERRIPLSYEQIPARMREAIMAIEDTRFFDHFGLDPYRLAGAVVQSLTRGTRAKGTSTLTQQLARELFLSKERSWVRKFKEAIYALQIERVYTKEQIFSLYCNQIFLGGGAYGFEAAANYYFSKSLKDLSLEQYALLASLPKAPQQYSPILRPKAAKDRRNLVLQAMAEAGFVSQAEADIAKAKPLGTNPNEVRNKNDKSPYAYFIEEVRQELQRVLERNSQDAMDVYKAGLSVYTTLDAEAQKLAVEAVRKGARNYQKRHGWKSIEFENILDRDDATTLENYQHYTWSAVAPKVEEILTGVVKEVNERAALVSFGSFSALVSAAETGAVNKAPGKLFKRGDLAQFRVEAVDEAKKTLKVKLEPEPEVQTALVSIESKTGEIKALVGGYDFSTTKFNHATQANRQTGSAFKPFIYAAALEWGLRPDDVVDDAPFKRGNWQPHNYDDQFMGAMPIRKAFALSRNIPAVRVLDEIGINNGVNMVKRMGLPNPMAPFLPSALGATEEPLLPMVSAYSVFPNAGVRVEPVWIRKVVDRDGNVIEEAKPKSYKVLSEYVASQMVDLMRGVVLEGTARGANAAGHEVAGKTGTVNEFSDAWFIGYTAKYTTGVWIGYSDSKQTLGKGESGASAALPFWNEFMKPFMQDKPKEKFPKAPPLPDDLRQLQLTRAREHANERSKLASAKGDLLPGSSDLPNLDPLGGRSGGATRDNAPASPPAPVVNKPEPTPRPLPPEPTRVESRPKIVRAPTPEPTPEPSKKGKKGKGNDN